VLEINQHDKSICIRQGSLELSFSQIDLCVLCVCVLLLSFFGHSALPPSRGGSASAPPLLSPTPLFPPPTPLPHLPFCSICYDRADDSSFHRDFSYWEISKKVHIKTNKHSHAQAHVSMRWYPQRRHWPDSVANG